MTNTAPAAQDQQVAAPKRRRWPVPLAAVIGLVIGIVIGSSGSGSSGSSAPATATAPAPAQDKATPAAPAPAPVPAKPAGIGDGTHTVPGEVQPGTYRTDGPADSIVPLCTWERLRNTSGEPSAMITIGTSQGPATVTIAPSDGAFQTSGCKPWTKVG